MKTHPITHSNSGGKTDLRYTITREFCGYQQARFVVRFCDEWIGQSQFYSAAVMMAVGHKSVRKGSPIIECKPA